MKKIIGFLFLAATLITLSCNDQPTPEKKEVVIVQPAPKKEVVVQQPVVTKEPEKQTSVTLDKNGVKVATKKVNVVVKQ